MSLTLVNSLQNLPSAKEEKGTGWYIGVVSDVSDPVDEDYIGLYVGQSHIVRMRIARHLWDRYTKDSFHYRTTRRVDKSVRYVTLGLINIEGLEETPKTVLLNIGELFLSACSSRRWLQSSLSNTSQKRRSDTIRSD